jgi:hypothetical protein
MCAALLPKLVTSPGVVFVSLGGAAYVAIVLRKDESSTNGWLKW